MAVSWYTILGLKYKNFNTTAKLSAVYIGFVVSLTILQFSFAVEVLASWQW